MFLGLRFPFISRPLNDNDFLEVQVFVVAALDFRSQVNIIVDFVICLLNVSLSA